MARDKFDLGAAIAGMVSNSDTNAPDVRMIPIEDIIPNKANFYNVDKDALRPLMDSIAMDGLHHYPLIVPHPEQAGKWQLIDGERRYTACRELVKEGNEKFKVIPCTVKEYSSAAFAKLQLILSNSTNRVLSPAEISKQAVETEMLFYQLKEEGYEFPGRMRDLVAAACNVSATKLARLKVIREGLHRDYQYLFEKNKLPEQTAYALARLPEDFQERIIKIMGATPPRGDAVERVLKEMELGATWDAEKLTCPNGRTCGGGDRFLRHDLDNPYDMCWGEKCCLTCEKAKQDYSPCDRMCSKAKKIRAEKREDEERSRKEDALFDSEEFKDATAKNAQRLLVAIDAAGLEDEARIRWSQYGGMYSVAQIRKWAAGEFDNSIWSDEKLSVDDLEYPLEIAEHLQCSTDYLFGLTDQLSGGGLELAWRSPADPPKVEGQCVAKFRIEGDAVVRTQLAFWKNSCWCFGHGATIDAECVGWWPVPEEE